MPFHQLLILLSAVLFFLATAVAWPRTTPPSSAWSMTLGWAGAFCFVLAGIVP